MSSVTASPEVGTFEVLTVGAADLRWSYEHGADPSLPTLPLNNTNRRRVTVDPFPCYFHQPAPLMTALITCMTAYPIPTGSHLTIVVAQFEETCRTNGFATYDSQWSQPTDPDCETVKNDPTSPACICPDGTWDYGQRFIFLSGKRTPIHPAMTRFVIAHEYGHQVEMWEATRRGLDLPRDEILDEYEELVRPGDQLHRATGGGRWHDSTAEVYADDFRTVMCGVETEHWPHYGIPERTDAVVSYWERVQLAVSPYEVPKPQIDVTTLDDPEPVFVSGDVVSGDVRPNSPWRE